MKRPEILAPAGSVQSAYSAINAGCDAVYVGGRKYGARAFADNPDNEELAGLIDDVHFYNRKIYITVNTVFNNNDFKELYDFTELIYQKGADAVIVQDLGVMDFIHREFPDMPIHASTQMNILQASAAELIKNYGVTRVIPARELSFAELSYMRKCTDLEIEVFVHGALCFSYSGQCLMSSLIGGRSGNKGACAQPCRKMYSYDKNKNNSCNMLSLKDLCSLNYIPELINAKIDSFKIEGRMKKPEYVALAAAMYRKYSDLYCELGKERYAEEICGSEEFKKDIKNLQDIYNRGGFTCGYLTQNTKRENMLSDKRTGHQGVKAGKVTGVFGNNTVEITFTEKTHKHDILEIRDRNNQAIHVHTLKDANESDRRIRINAGYNASKISRGFDVFRIRNNELINNILDLYPSVRKKAAISGVFTARRGEKMSLYAYLSDSPDDSCIIYGDVPDKAKRQSVTKQVIENKIKVSGDSLFCWDMLDICIDTDIFISASALKNIRREALKELYDVIVSKYHRKAGKVPAANDGRHMYKGICKAQKEIIAECRNKLQFDCINTLPEIDTIYIHITDIDMYDLCDMLERADKPVYIVMPQIFRYDGQAYFENEYDMKIICSYPKFRGIIVCSLCELAWFKEHGYDDTIDIRAAANLYARNLYAYNWLRKQGISVCQAPSEMSMQELLAAGECDYDIAVYKRDTAMVTAICMDKYNKIYDSYGNAYRVFWHDKYKYTEIMHYEIRDYIDAIPIHSFNRIRLSFYDEKPSDIKSVIRRFKENTK